MKVAALLLILFSLPLAAAEKQLKAFPPAGEGMTRHVIILPVEEDESRLRVELKVGKTRVQA